MCTVYDSGHCVKLRNRCDNTVDCEDRSDENECARVYIPEEYDKDDNIFIDKRLFREKMRLTNEVKKVGVIIDRGQKMEFRGGDLLLIYVSMGGFEK